MSFPSPRSSYTKSDGRRGGEAGIFGPLDAIFPFMTVTAPTRISRALPATIRRPAGGQRKCEPKWRQYTWIRLASDNPVYRNFSKHNQIARLNRVHRDPRRTMRSFAFRQIFAIRDRNERSPPRSSEFISNSTSADASKNTCFKGRLETVSPSESTELQRKGRSRERFLELAALQGAEVGLRMLQISRVFSRQNRD